MEEIRTYPEMNEKIKDILKIDSDPFYLYVARRVEELEQEVKDWKRKYKVLDKLLSESYGRMKQ